MNHLQHRHIDVVVKYFYPVAAGIETNILETYSVLVKKGWDVTVHTTDGVLTQKSCLPPSDIVKGIKVRRYPLGLFGFSPKINWSRTDFVCLHNFNVFPHFQIMLRTIWLKLFRKKSFALFLTPHGGFNPEWTIFSFPVRLIKSFYHFTVGALLINLSVDGVRAVSEWERHEMLLKHLNPHLLKTISNGLEDEAYVDVDASASPDIKSQVALWGKYIIQIGRVYRIKNYETTLKALPLLPPDINYVIVGPVGDEQYKLRLLKLIDDLNIQNRVFFAGVIRGVDKYYVIKHSEMMVHMAVWESYCNVIHEAMSQGRVVLAADNTAMPLLIKNGINGYCLPTFDHRLLAKNIIKLLDPGSIDLKNRIEANNRRIGLNDSWSQVARRMSDFYLDNYSRVNPVQYLFAYAK